MIELRNVTKYYQTREGVRYLLRNVSLTIPAGTNLAVLGPPLDIHFYQAYPAMEKGIAEVNELYLEGKLNPGVSETYPLGEFKKAFARITGRNVMGKIVLEP